MITHFFTTVFYQPLYNGLIFLFKVLPWADAGLIIIVFTVVVKLILFPLSVKATRAQMEIKEIEADLAEIKEMYKDNKELQTTKTMALYKDKNINPFAGFVILLIQFPIIIALYQIFLKSGLPAIDMALLYSFIPVPAFVDMTFFWIGDLAGKSIILAFIAGISTYFQVKYSTPADLEPKNGKPVVKNTQGDVMKAFQTQMKYVFPVLVFFISWSISAAISLYWITSNIFTVGQEIYIRKRIHRSIVSR
jgi:YidC/Oxa1 family membrane protein insertase